MQRRKSRAAAGILAAILIVTGCQKSPDTSIVSNKDFDEMIEQAEQTEATTTEVAELADDYETYHTDISDESRYVSVHVDAKVEVPDAEKLSVYRVKQKEISQEFLDKVRETLIGDTQMYDGGYLHTLTKKDLEREIGVWQGYIDEYENNSLYSDEDRQTIIDEYQREIDEAQEQYESAPDELDVTENPIDDALQSVADAYAQNPNDSYLEWQYSLNDTGEYYYGVNDAADGNYLMLYAQNNEDDGNKLVFAKSKEGYVAHGGVLPTNATDDYYCAGGDFVWPAEDELPDERFYGNDYKNNGFDWDSLQESTDELLTISEEEAQTQADALLEKLGLDVYQCCYSGAIKQIPDISNRSLDDTLLYRKVYVFSYVRNIDGVNLLNKGEDKLTDGYQGDTYVKKLWCGEGITILVNDDGIVEFDYNVPLEVTETVVEQANVISFEEAKDTFEQMITTVYAATDADSANEITVDQVVLHYARISEADSFDTGLLVPVWDFIGSWDDGANYRKNMAVLSVNAIDGSVIDGELGY